MKKLLMIIPVVFCNILYGQSEKSYQCYWHETGTDVFVAHSTDFKYSENDMLYYRISNDRDNIYVDVKIFDDEIKQQVLSSGLTIWIDPEGKKLKKTGIVYPVRMPDQRNSISTDVAKSQETHDSQNFHNMYEHHDRRAPGNIADSLKNSIRLLGFSDSGPVMVTSNENDNFKGSLRVRKEENMLFYKVIMPKWRSLRRNA